jgi:hypothetical protein
MITWLPGPLGSTVKLMVVSRPSTDPSTTCRRGGSWLVTSKIRSNARLLRLRVLAKFGADLDRAAANDLGPLHVGIPFSKPALIRYVRERFVHRWAHVRGFAESTHDNSLSGRASTQCRQ